MSYRNWGTSEDGKIKFESLTTETLDGAIDVMKNNFVINESACAGIGVASDPGATEDVLNLLKEAARDGISIVAIDTSAKEVIGALFTKIQVNTPGKTFFEQFRDNNCKHKASKAFLEFNVNVDGRMNLYKYFNVDCILELMCISVMPAYGRRQVAEKLVASALEIGKDLKRGNDVRVPVTVYGNNTVTNGKEVPSLYSSILTSKYSQKIADKFNFRELLRISLEEFEFEGKKYRDRITSQHIDCTLVAKPIEP